MNEGLYCRAGQLRHKLRLERHQYPQNLASGEPQAAGPYTVEVVLGSVEPLSGRELWVARQSQPDVSHRVRIRYRRDLAPGDVLEHDGRKLRVLSVLDPAERHRMLELVCAEQVGED